jgi:hypothetical protein
MQSLPVELLRSLVDLTFEFGGIASSSPAQAILLLAGALITAFSVIVFAYLAFGAFVRPLGNLPAIGRGQKDRRETIYREGTGGREKQYLEGDRN